MRIVNALHRIVKANAMKRSQSPPISPEMAAHIRFLVKVRGLYQHQAAALVGVNQGRVSEVVRGYRHPGVGPAQGAFPF
jgi:predicted XRE-type DNA-binding protein